MARENDGALCGVQHFNGTVEFRLIMIIPQALGRKFWRGRFPVELGGGLLRVFGNVDQHRAGTSAISDQESFADGARNVFCFRDHYVVLWNASEPRTLLLTWPVMQTTGDESSMAVAMPVTMFVAPGPDVAMATPTPPLARA